MKEIYGHAAADLNPSSWKKLDAIGGKNGEVG
jgi:hypothetical protein